jgi:ribosome-binding factor A
MFGRNEFEQMSRHRTPRGGNRIASRHARREMGPSQRQLRVGEMLRHALAGILSRSDIRDPELEGVSVTITQVKPSPDMRYATVYCAPLGGGNAGPVIAALNRHKGFLRGQMGHMISTKFTPDLRFVEDQSFAEAEKIENLLKSPEVQRDLAHSDEREDSDD